MILSKKYVTVVALYSSYTVTYMICYVASLYQAEADEKGKD